MNLKEDLARNRAVFEKLTGGAVKYAEPDPPARIKKIYEEEISAVSKPFYSAPEPVQTFSLSGTRKAERSTGMSLSFKPPEDLTYPEFSKPDLHSVTYPELGKQEPVSESDTLDMFYRKLDIEARQSSQLSFEEDF